VKGIKQSSMGKMGNRFFIFLACSCIYYQQPFFSGSSGKEKKLVYFRVFELWWQNSFEKMQR
jgi:hypothetical protein